MTKTLEQVSYKSEKTQKRAHRRPFQLPIALILLCSFAIYGYQKFFGSTESSTRQHEPALAITANPVRPEPTSSIASGKCDGRIYCSQMTSCSEAKFFLANCPGVKMDGNNDGIPCEQQWCTSPFAK